VARSSVAPGGQVAANPSEATGTDWYTSALDLSTKRSPWFNGKATNATLTEDGEMPRFRREQGPPSPAAAGPAQRGNARFSAPICRALHPTNAGLAAGVPDDRSGAAQVPGVCQFLTNGGSSTIGDQSVDRTKTRCRSHERSRI